ncbi:hypothetical protein DKG71_26515 [Streptomyces sp. NEAU-S7GS2]|nr:hypothetical protein DKG71_26515 [Streptomyces sp. NEAU-S7GS2]
MDSREALAAFVRSLHRDYADNAASWDNADLGDAAGWYRRAGHDLPDSAVWACFARALSAAAVYE